MKDALRAFASAFTPPGGETGGDVALPSLTGAADAFLALTLSDSKEFNSSSPRLVAAITPGIPDADRLIEDLQILSQNLPVRILEFPPLITGDKSAFGLRLKTVAAIKSWGLSPYPCGVVASVPALAAPLPMGSVPSLTLGTLPNNEESKSLKFADICQKLTQFGYNRLPTVEQAGDYSVRGGILDVWSPGEEFPVRAEFFGDELESLRTFDAATQISIARIKSATIMPVGTLPGESTGTPPVEGNLIDLLPANSTILALEHNSYDLTLYRRGADKRPVVYTGDPAPAGTATCDLRTSPLPGFSELGADEAHHPELFDSARRRLEQHIDSAKRRGDAVVGIDELSGGFELNRGDGRSLIVLTKADRVFTKKKTRMRSSALCRQGARINDFDELEPGEYVVHVDYGVGRFIGSSEITTAGKRSEVFTVEYADGAKLHVPAAHAHLLSRYIGVKGEDVRLHRLDGKRWEKDRRAAQKAVADLAASLLETQAQREITPGFGYDVECEGIEAFEAAFPYEETPDQLAAIAAVKSDLAAARPMDRLICGDAGYGKTEVAMRAAYIAAMNAKQVAVLAPTTVLAEQHFETFTSRFDGTPIRIESVSRFQSALTHRGTFSRIASGACDIVIGTHAILSSKISFRDLGLIIIDEEQRFGVRHKEFLKHLRATADVLTLSATPIPRTLYLSMTGARDLSLLRTAPRERVAVDIKIVRDSDQIIAAAISAELERAGQVFFLHNRVATIGGIEKRLKKILPSVRVVTAHGRMDAKTLASKMRDFERGEYDVLLSTTIVESGIDIPRANTIIIDQAHTFGLADLYQLRGRVGRASAQGRALLLLPPSGIVDSDARERLKALQRHSALGAGFNLAVRDLELRGAGNLLGSQQSGHIAAVGFGLYCQLLQRTVAMLKGEKVRETVDVKLNLDFLDLSPASCDDGSAAALPYGYVEEDSQRMGFMKRLAEAQSGKAVRSLAAELEDRFGKMPAAARRLIRTAQLRMKCSEKGISAIDVRNERAVYYRSGSNEIAFVRILKGRTADQKLRELDFT